MLKPTILYKQQEIEQKLAERLYTKDFFYYQGYPQWFNLPKIEAKENHYQWAIVDKDDKLIGYFDYMINLYVDNVYSFGFISFDKGNIFLVRDVIKKLEELINERHRVEWCAVGGNPAIRAYKRFCNRHGGQILRKRDAVKDERGELSRRIFV